MPYSFVPEQGGPGFGISPTYHGFWVAVKGLGFRVYPPIMENQMEKKMENEMEAGGI